MSLSSFWWFGSVVSRGGMYMFASVICFVVLRWILVSCSSVFCVFIFLGMSSSVKVMLFLMYVSRPPPCLCVLSVREGV